MEHLWLWTRFAAASLLIVLAGSRLSRYADVFSEKLRLGHVFVGMIFLGWITSLPELVLSLGSTIYVGEPDLAIGNVLGSCLFNLIILVVVDIIILGGLFFTRTSMSSLTTGLVSMLMLLTAAAGLQAGSANAPTWVTAPAGLHMDLFSWLIILFYLGSTAYLYILDRRKEKQLESSDEPLKYADTKIAGVVLASVLATAVIVGAGLYLANIGDEIAATYSIAHSFVGTLFFAVVSSLPELTTTIAAARLGFLDMSLGNIFGSNIFNIMIIGVSDAFYTKGSIFASPETHNRSHLFVALFAIVATVAVVCGLKGKSGRLFWRVSIISIIVAICYFAGLILNYAW